MTKKRKAALSLIAVTVIWTLAIEVMSYAGYLYTRHIHDEISHLQADRAVLKYQVVDAYRRLQLCEISVERLTGASYKPQPLPRGGN